MMAVKKHGMSVMIKQELIEDKGLIKAFVPLFSNKEEGRLPQHQT